MTKIYANCESEYNPKVVYIKDEEIIQEGKLFIIQGRYSDLYDTYVCSTTWFEDEGEIYMLTTEGEKYLGKCNGRVYAIMSMGNGQTWFYVSESDENGDIYSVYSMVGNQETKKLFSGK